MAVNTQHQVEKLDPQIAPLPRRELKHLCVRGVVGAPDLVELAKYIADDDTTALQRRLAASQLLARCTIRTWVPAREWDARQPPDLRAVVPTL